MLVSEMDVMTPIDLQDCLHILHTSTNYETRIIAGGTDAVVRMKDEKWLPALWINIKDLNELRFIQEVKDEIHIGALSTHTDIVQSPLLTKKADVLVQAAKEVGATQMQNMGTLGGNVATASPAGDTIPALYVLSAKIEATSLDGVRHIPIEEFFIGPGKTTLKRNELITKIILRKQLENEVGVFEKLGPRKAQSISIVNFACSIVMEDGRKCLGGKMAFGSVAPTVIRAKKCESMLTLDELNGEMIQNIAKVAWKEVAPITDVRATASYRRDMASALLERGLIRLMTRWNHR
ncbi:xanthine dehydrogenase family protein subunit M [Bacillus timonensis]|nr:xanthine dehydrogenase family protein subunit M [Bacillus timonensis]